MTILPWIVSAGCLFAVMVARLLTNHFIRQRLATIVDSGTTTGHIPPGVSMLYVFGILGLIGCGIWSFAIAWWAPIVPLIVYVGQLLVIPSGIMNVHQMTTSRRASSGQIIFDFIERNDEAKTRQVLALMPNVVFIRDSEGNTPLHAAAACNACQIASVLLEHGADINARRNNGAAPLHMATHAGQIDMVRFLLNRGGDPNAKAEKKLTPLHMAAAGGKNEVVLQLIEHGADKRVTDDWGKTPLSWATDCEHPDLVSMLS
jgi:Ankyrin repeats (3 copies)/Ankyrin repeat